MLLMTADSVRSEIRELLKEKSVTVMIDGWSDLSLRRYLGIGVAFFDASSRQQKFRFLDLNFGITGHSAVNQISALRQCLESFHISGEHVQCPRFRFCQCEYGCCRQDGLELDAMLASFMEAYREKLHTVLPRRFPFDFRKNQ